MNALDPNLAGKVAQWASKFPDHAVPPRVRFRVLDDADQDVTKQHFDALKKFGTQVAGDPALRRGGMPLRVLGGLAGLGVVGVALWGGYEVWAVALPADPIHWSHPNPVPAAMLARLFLTACGALGVVTGTVWVGDALRSRAPESSTVKFNQAA